LEKFFLNYNWEGNVRELKHIIESMVSLSDCKTLDVHHLPAYMYDRLFNNKITISENTEDERDILLNTEYFNLNKKEENIIKGHMFPFGIPKSKEAWIVSFVDKYIAVFEYSSNLKKIVQRQPVYNAE